jgi:hypothetical protein
VKLGFSEKPTTLLWMMNKFRDKKEYINFFINFGKKQSPNPIEGMGL